MAELTPIDIRIDEAALRERVSHVISEEIKQFSLKLRWAADSLDPQFAQDFTEYWQSEVDKAYQRGLSERDG